MFSKDLIHFFNRHKALCLMILVVPFSDMPELSQSLGGIPGLKIINVLGALVVALWITKGGEFVVFRDVIRFRATIFCYMLIAVFSITFFRSYLNLDTLMMRQESFYLAYNGSSFKYMLSAWIKPLLYVGPFLYILNHVKGKKDVEALVDFVLISYCFFAITTLPISIKSILNGESREVLKVAFSDAFGIHRNVVGTFVMLIVPLVLSRALSIGKAWYVILGLAIFAMLLTQSRGAMLGAISGMMFYFYLERRIGVGMIIVLLLMGGVVAVVFEAMKSLYETSVQGATINQMSSGRIDTMWLPLVGELSQNPVALIFGFGTNGMILTDSYVSNPYFFQATHAHNAFLTLTVEAGLIVLVPFLILSAWAYRKAVKWGRILDSASYRGLFSCLVAYYAAATIGREFFPGPETMLLLVMVPMMLVMVSEYRAKYGDQAAPAAREGRAAQAIPDDGGASVA